MSFNFTKVLKVEEIIETKELVDLTPILAANPIIDTSLTCIDCPLMNDDDDALMPLGVAGQGKLKTLIVFSHPTKRDMINGKLGSAQAYHRLAHDLLVQGVDINEDCWVTSAVRCYPQGRVPSKKMYEVCRGKLLKTVQRLKPTTVLIVGRNAMHGWIGHQFSVPPRQPDPTNYMHDTDYDVWVGHTIPDHEYAFEVDGRKVCPTVIPLFNMHDVSKFEVKNIERGSTESVIPTRHRAVLAMAVDIAKEKVAGTWKEYEPFNMDAGGAVQCVYSAQEAIQILHALNIPSIIAIDYETTGLKPYNKGHKILMVGISNGVTSYAIPFFENNPEFVAAYRDLMINPLVQIICHNLKFEYNWTRKILGCRMQGVLWDTMLVAHILDMRDGITGLKIQGYLKFGIAGYEKVTKKLLSSIEKKQGANGKNWLQYLNPDKLNENAITWDFTLKYVGKDAALTRALYSRQKEELLYTDFKHLNKGIALFMKSSITLAEMEFNGFVFDYAQCQENKILIAARMVELQTAMTKSKEYAKWKAVYPDKELNTNSPKQLVDFLYTILGYKVPKLNKSDNPSTDKEALEDINSEFTQYLLLYKGLDKMRNAFLNGYEQESNDDGHLRCFFNLNNVKSYRTSSSNVNLQNVSHHSEISKYALNLMKPLPGHVIFNADFKALEVYCSAVTTRDPKLLEYVHDESTDMHRDVACDIHFYSQEDLPKRLRTLAKKFVFACFYGAGYRSITNNQWKGMTQEDKERLKEHGIRNYIDFEKHIQNMFNKFWNVRFKTYTNWKKKQWDFYTNNGYFVGHTGFLYTGVCNKRQTSNFGIQGDATHIMLHMANYLFDYIEDNSLYSRLLITVHDSVLLSCPQEEVPLFEKAIQEFLKTVPVLEPWTKGVDFAVEVETSEIDGDWGHVTPISLIRGSHIQTLEKIEE